MPLRLEVGPRDFEARQVTVARRDSPPGTKGVGMPVDGLGPKIAELLEQFQADLFATAKKARDEKLVQVWEWKDFVPALNQNCIVLTPFCNEIEWEEQVKTRAATGTSTARPRTSAPRRASPRRRSASVQRVVAAPVAPCAGLLPPFPPPARAILDGRDSHARSLVALRAKPTCPRAPCFVSGKPATCWVLWGGRISRDRPSSRSCAVARVRGLLL